MDQRVVGNRRPTGTDGSDFSYRMVVDNRYTKVAQAKSQLANLLIVQAFAKLLVAINIGLMIIWMKDDSMDKLGIFSVILGFVSVIIGESGRRRSKAILLKLFLIGSTISIVLSSGFTLLHVRSLQVVAKDPDGVMNSVIIAYVVISVVLDVLFQFKVGTTTFLLIGNMKPPKKTS